VHPCGAWLRFLRLNTMPTMNGRLLEVVGALRKISLRSLVKFGPLAAPKIRQPGEGSFRRIQWDDSVTVATEGLKTADLHSVACFIKSRGRVKEA
jgi:hypothetical protein